MKAYLGLRDTQSVYLPESVTHRPALRHQPPGTGLCRVHLA